MSAQPDDAVHPHCLRQLFALTLTRRSESPFARQSEGVPERANDRRRDVFSM